MKYSTEAVCELNPGSASRYWLKDAEMICIEPRKRPPGSRELAPDLENKAAFVSIDIHGRE